MQYVTRQYVRVVSVFCGFYAPYLLSAHLLDLPLDAQDGDRLLLNYRSSRRVFSVFGSG